jgi:plastocyanin
MAPIRLATIFLVLAATIQAEDIHGTIIVKQRLTRQRVTAAPALYQRGPAVALVSDAHDDPLASERARVVVYIEGSFPSESNSSPRIAATMEQKDRRFVPELLAIPVGSSVSFPNLDPIFHNVFSLSKPKSFDLGNYSRNQTRTVTFSKPGVEFVNCHLHPNMSAAIVVTPNKWCVIADRNGQFSLHGVPAGPYTVVAWHKAAGCIKQTVSVVPNRGAAVDFFVPIDENGVTRVEALR